MWWRQAILASKEQADCHADTNQKTANEDGASVNLCSCPSYYQLVNIQICRSVPVLLCDVRWTTRVGGRVCNLVDDCVDEKPCFCYKKCGLPHWHKMADDRCRLGCMFWCRPSVGQNREQLVPCSSAQLFPRPVTVTSPSQSHQVAPAPRLQDASGHPRHQPHYRSCHGKIEN